jgi:dihydroorotase
MLVLPGAVDMHVHMRGGSQRAKEDWRTGSESALAGGVTVVVDQPNTIPPLADAARFADRVTEARAQSRCNFAINGGVLPGTDMPGLWKAGAMAFGELFCATSSYAEALSPGVLVRALEQAARIAALATIHAETILEGRDCDLASHHALRSPGGEARAVGAVRAKNSAGCRLHFCHLSTGAAIDAAGDSTVEVTPHHLILSMEEFDGPDPRGKVNPPLRAASDRDTLWARWDRVDVLASDHAPHTAAEKSVDFSEAPSGMPGVETMVPLLLAACRARRIPLITLMEKSSWKPATILGIPRAGFAVGDRADFAVYPEQEERVRAENLHSRAGWTPFEGRPATFPELVVQGGLVAFRGGEYAYAAPRWFPGRGYIPPAQMENGADTARP